jgi:hypothetical protein
MISGAACAMLTSTGLTNTGFRTTKGGADSKADTTLSTSADPKIRKLDQANLLGFFALLAWCNFEFDCVALVEGLVARSFDVGEVDEHVVATFSRDEAETFFGVEKLNCACGHYIYPNNKMSRRFDDYKWDAIEPSTYSSRFSENVFTRPQNGFTRPHSEGDQQFDRFDGSGTIGY